MNDTLLVAAERDICSYPEFDGSTEMPATIWAPENDFVDQVNAVRGLLDTYSLLYPRLQDVDLREELPRLDVPVYLVVGEHEARGRVEPAQEWFEPLQAPDKTWVELPASGHRASFEQPDAYARLMQQVLTETAETGWPDAARPVPPATVMTSHPWSAPRPEPDASHLDRTASSLTVRLRQGLRSLAAGRSHGAPWT